MGLLVAPARLGVDLGGDGVDLGGLGIDFGGLGVDLGGLLGLTWAPKSKSSSPRPRPKATPRRPKSSGLPSFQVDWTRGHQGQSTTGQGPSRPESPDQGHSSTADQEEDQTRVQDRGLGVDLGGRFGVDLGRLGADFVGRSWGS